MSLKNIKSNPQAQKGFTIVELLIVVVVIAILAAITIVSYNGITSRANASSAQATASSLQKKIELFAADGTTGTYPRVIGDLTTGVGITGKSFYVTPNSIKLTALPTTNPDATNGKDTVRYQPCGTGTVASTMTAVRGAIITWWDFVTSTAVPIYVGDTTAPCALTLV